MIDYRPQTPGGFVIFCDDIREEKSGKRIYTGVYNSNLVINAHAPVLLPKLGFAVHYFERPGESDDPVRLIVRLPGDDKDSPTIDFEIPVTAMRNAELPRDPEADDPRRALIMHFEMAPFEAKQTGRIHVRAIRGDLEIRLGSLLVEFRPPADDAEPIETDDNALPASSPSENAN